MIPYHTIPYLTFEGVIGFNPKAMAQIAVMCVSGPNTCIGRSSSMPIQYVNTIVWLMVWLACMNVG